MSEDNYMNFSLTVLPGIEDIAQKEFEKKWSLINSASLPEIQRKKGKLFITSDISDFCSLIPYLRIPTDAYLIIDEFVAKDRPKIFNKVAKIPWHNFLRGDFPLVIVTTKESKLINSSSVKQSVESGLKDALKKSPIKKVPKSAEPITNKLHIDLYQDRLRISLSLCGSRMDKRGVKLYTDTAPLRESIAAAMLFTLSELAPNQKLLDPMAGTGTFGLESILYNKYNEYRSFDYQLAPFFINLPLRKRVKIEQGLFTSITLHDLSPKAIESIKYNFKDFLESVEEISVQDFFKLAKSNATVAILNPPYGKRIKLEEELNIFIERIITHSKNTLELEKLAMVFPAWAFHKLRDLKISEKRFFSNGGIDVVFVIIDLL
ncbi:hypothetical protein [Halobacteriovorax sp. JY17]|uniref:hypothetical protein n=1 Tax=Halobacteriovorax sp. JY17 TaxID=2014617 RepID=UPI000C444D7C|nr:hypothetical protein [Halobacteriovorax sp. JY17]PIK15482.1 MAG: hypothetical protein CES88_01820 [Halobacteriovorax sp. JY17]